MRTTPANPPHSFMKITYTQIVLAALFPIMGLHLYSCVKNSSCPDPPETITVDLPQKLKNCIPYTGKDTLTFIRKTVGDTHTFIGQGLKKGYNLEQRDYGDEECRSSGGQAMMEFIQYTFKSSTFTSPIILDVYYLRYPVVSWIDIRFKDKTFDAPTTVFTPFAKDSFLIASRMYYDIATIADDLNPSSKEYFTLFNAANGILKFRFQTGEEWELLPKP
jgi:hypothetical protein